MTWRRVHLCTGILERDGCILLVANRYPNLPDLLWNIPGGRQEAPETVEAAVRREFAEETNLRIRVGRLAYVAESFDLEQRTQFTNFAFHVETSDDPALTPEDAHVVAYRWVAIPELRDALRVAVVREPLVAHLADQRRQYFPYGDPGITIEFAD